MRLVIFARVPRWYSFRNDRLVDRMVRDGHEVAGVVVQRASVLAMFRQLMSRLGPRLFFGKSIDRLRRFLTSNGIVPKTRGDRQSKVAVHFVENHNTPECIELVRSLRPDLVILRGSGIVKDAILKTPKIGTVNAHWGLLPEFRGVDVTEWAALSGHSIGVTVHFVNAGIDAGPTLLSRKVTAESGDDTGTLREKSSTIGIELISEAIRELEQGSLVPVPQDLNAGRQYFSMHYRLRELANRRLQKEWHGNNHP